MTAQSMEIWRPGVIEPTILTLEEFERESAPIIRPPYAECHAPRSDGMDLEFKAIPTQYRGVNFRSRLEARWVAFFDLVGFVWEFEPEGFDGWLPDFRIRIDFCRDCNKYVNVYAEVKPIDLMRDDNRSPYGKAVRQSSLVQVLLLGTQPMCIDEESIYLGVLTKRPAHEQYSWHRLNEKLTTWHPPPRYMKLVEKKRFADATDYLWNYAGNRTQYRAHMEG